jgi:hypothetical protein
VAGSKKFNFKDKLDHMLNGQSIIKEVNSDEDMESPNKDKTIQQEKQEQAASMNNDKEDYKLKIIYFLKDLSKVILL